MVWKIDVGQGFSAPVVARGRVILFHRLENRAIVESLDALTGRRVWSALSGRVAGAGPLRRPEVRVEARLGKDHELAGTAGGDR